MTSFARHLSIDSNRLGFPQNKVCSQKLQTSWEKDNSRRSIVIKQSRDAHPANQEKSSWKEFMHVARSRNKDSHIPLKLGKPSCWTKRFRHFKTEKLKNQLHLVFISRVAPTNTKTRLMCLPSEAQLVSPPRSSNSDPRDLWPHMDQQLEIFNPVLIVSKPAMGPDGMIFSSLYSMAGQWRRW